MTRSTLLAEALVLAGWPTLGVTKRRHKAQNRSSSSPSLVSRVPIAAVMKRSTLLAVALVVVILAGCVHIARYYRAHATRATASSLALPSWRHNAQIDQALVRL